MRLLRRFMSVVVLGTAVAAGLPAGAGVLAPAPAQANHYCPAGARGQNAKVQLWVNAKCSGGSVIVPFSGDANRPDFRAFLNGPDQKSYNVDNTRSSLAIGPGYCVRLFDGLKYTGEMSNLLCTPPSAEDWGLFAFDNRASSMKVCTTALKAACGAGPVAPAPSGGGTPTPTPTPTTTTPAPTPTKPTPTPSAPPAGDPSSPTPGPTPAPAPRCIGTTLKLGPFTATASCFKKDGSAYVATGQVRIAGVDISTAGAGASVRLDPRTLTVVSKGSTQVKVGGMVLYRRAVSWKLGGTLTFDTERGIKLRGLPVSGTASLTANAATRTVSVGLNVALPSVLGGITGSTTIQAGVDGAVVSDIKVTAGSARIGTFEVRDLSLAYASVAGGAYHLDGSGTLVLPSPLAPTISARLGFGVGDDYFRLGGSVDGLNAPLAFGITLQRIRFDVQIAPVVRLSGGMGISAGPRILGREAVSIDGDFIYEDSDPDRYTIAGSARIADIEVASGEATYQTDGRFDLKADLDFQKYEVGFRGHVEGWVDGANAFNFQGDGRLKAGPFSENGAGVVSSDGIAACRHGFGPDVGFGYRWAGDVDIMASSCNIGPWVVQRAIRALGDPTFKTFGIGRNLPVAVFSVVSDQAAPKVVLTDPAGRDVAVTPDDPAAGIDDGRVLLFQNPTDKTTYIALKSPVAGAYRLSLRAGSVPATTFRSAQALRAPAITGRVGGTGYRRVLKYRYTPVKGRSIVFYEQGRDTRRRLAVKRSPRGIVRFSVPDGKPGRRDIVAVVRQDGHTQSAGVVAHYTAPMPRRPLTPRLARVRVRRGAFVVTWGTASRAASYEIRVALSDGRSLLYLPGKAERRVTIPRARLGVRVGVSIRGVSATGRRGSPATASVRSK